MQNDMSDEKQARADAARAIVQAADALNDAVAAAAKLGVYAELNIHTIPDALDGTGKPRQQYTISILRKRPRPSR